MLPMFRPCPYRPLVAAGLVFGLLIAHRTTVPLYGQMANVRQASHIDEIPGQAATSKFPEFVVTTTIASSDPPATLSRHHTVFRDGVVYDIPQLHRRFATILDLNSSCVVLLDRQHRTQCVLSTESLTKVAAAIEAEVTDPAKRDRMGMNAEVTVSDNGVWQVDYPGVRYRITPAIPSDKRFAIHYGQFVDWMCRLNLVRPGGVPPFGRMKANRALTTNHQIGQTTQLELVDPDGATKRFESETEWSTRMDTGMADQVAELAGMRITFRQIPLEDFGH